jgi:hypothetical protein
MNVICSNITQMDSCAEILDLIKIVIIHVK